MQPDQNSPDLLHYQPATPPASSANSVLSALLGDQDFYTAEQVAERVSSFVQEVAISYEQPLSVLEAEHQRLREYVVALPVPPLESPNGVSQPPFTQLPSTVSLSQLSNGSCSVSRLTRTINSLSIEDGAVKRAREALRATWTWSPHSTETSFSGPLTGILSSTRVSSTAAR
jgi:hypothetical protein